MDSPGRKNSDDNIPALVSVTAIAVFCMVFAYWIVSVDVLLPYLEGASYLYRSFITYDNLRGNPADLIGVFLRSVDIARPPILYFSAALSYFLLGESVCAAYAVVLFYALAALIFTYKIGDELGGRRAGLMAVLYVLGFGLFHVMARIFVTELPLMAFLLASVYLSISQDCLTDWRKTVLLGLSISGGLLSRGEFAFFFLPTGIQMVSGGVSKRRKDKLIHLVALALLVSFLAVPWYAVNFERSIVYTYHIAFDAEKPLLERALAWESIIFYPREYFQSSPLLSLLSIPALFMAFRSRNNALKVLALTLPLVYIIYLFPNFKIVRFLSPLIPLAGVLVGCMVSGIADKRLLVSVTLGLAIIAAYTMATQYFSLVDGEVRPQPFNPNDRSEKMVEIISRYTLHQPERPANVLVISHLLRSYNQMNVMALSHLRGIHMTLADPIGFLSQATIPYNLSAIDYAREVSSSDFIVKNNRTACFWAFLSLETCKETLQNYHDEFERQKGDFTKIGSVYSEADGEIEIYKKKG